MRIVSVNVARASAIEIQGRRVLTAIGKRPVAGAVAVHRQVGLSKAVYAYPIEHYPFWQTVRAQAGVAAWDEVLPHGAMGENLTIEGLLESQVWVGDLLRFPDCELLVSEPRYPCFKLNAAMGFNQAGKLMAANAWCGYYLAVRTGGTLTAGDSFELIPGPREVGIQELFRSRMARAKST